jgi:two-component system OmpR family response regulator/two-component system alkaline phosphatase synthesis response regulator PhoP
MTQPSNPQYRILVVDDEPFLCDALKMILAGDGHSVDTAYSAKEALALYDEGKYDLILTDYVMPGMKGDALAATIKARSSKQAIIMVTAYAEKLQGEGALCSVDAMICKPFLLEDLRQAVAKVTR